MASNGELFKVFGRIGLLSFGGPAGQIALMHRTLVDEKGWLEERQFLHALNFCMLLPGPEAMQLATYSGWLLKGISGGLMAGLLFILPGALVIASLSWLYVAFGDVSLVSGLLFGLQAAVLAIVAQALWRVSGRALKGRAHWIVAVAAFIALAIFSIPFPFVIAGAALAGWLLPQCFIGDVGQADGDHEMTRHLEVRSGYLAKVVSLGVLAWGAPVAALLLMLGQGNVFADLAVFFSTAAVVTFGGAYAVLAYVAQQAVENYQWLQTGEMVTGLGLAETTPGPLILVLEFVGFVAGWRTAAGGSLLGGLLGAFVTLWVTFVPCFIWIFAGAPYIEKLRGNAGLSAALAGVTAAVVGVMVSLAIWFAINVLFVTQTTFSMFGLDFQVPILGSLEPIALFIAMVSTVMLFTGRGLFTVLGMAVGVGVVSQVV